MKQKYVLRVLSGTDRGRGIQSPCGDAVVRPTSARVKAAMFNIIRMDLPGETFVDLFAGTGQMGLEAVSNGAKAIMIDRDPALAQKNVSALGKEKAVTFYKGDFCDILHSFAEKKLTFRFIFADPPYHAGLYSSILEAAYPVLKSNGILILEHSSGESISVLPEYELLSQRVYGSRTLSILGVAHERDDLSGEL